MCGDDEELPGVLNNFLPNKIYLNDDYQVESNKKFKLSIKDIKIFIPQQMDMIFK